MVAGAAPPPVLVCTVSAAGVPAGVTASFVFFGLEIVIKVAGFFLLFDLLWGAGVPPAVVALGVVTKGAAALPLDFGLGTHFAEPALAAASDATTHTHAARKQQLLLR